MAARFFRTWLPKRFGADNFSTKTFEGEAGVTESLTLESLDSRVTPKNCNLASFDLKFYTT